MTVTSTTSRTTSSRIAGPSRRRTASRRPPTLTAVPADDAQAGFLLRAQACGVHPDGRWQLGDLDCQTDRYAVSRGGVPAPLSPRQVELLALFLAAPQRVWSREQLHWICWGDAVVSRRVDVQLCRIRGKLGLDLFRNIRDRGWTLAS